MRICVITRSYNQLLGGMEYATQELCRGLVLKGHEVCVLTSAHKDSKGLDEIYGVKVFYALSGRPGKYSNAYFTYIEDMFYQLHEKTPFDIIHVESTSLKFKPPIPYVMRMHGTNYTEFMCALNNLFNPVSWYVMLKQVNLFLRFNQYVKEAAAVIAISNKLKNQINWEYKPRKTKLIYNGIDTELFRPLPRIMAGKTILYVGRPIPEKGYNDLVELMPAVRRIIHEAELFVVGGDGDTTAEVTYLGRKPREKLPDLYKNCDLVAFPTKRLEGLPLVVLEAMACGRPVITTELGGGEIIDHNKDGIITSPNETEKWIIKLLQDGERTEALGAKAREKILDKFTLDKMVDGHLELYNEVINNG